jgi:hypothetical protein
MIIAMLRSSPSSGSGKRYLRLADATTSYSLVRQPFAPIMFKDLHKMNLLSGGDVEVVVREALWRLVGLLQRDRGVLRGGQV